RIHPMKGQRTRCPALVALAVLLVTAGQLSADLYNKGPAKRDPAALPTPAEVRALTVSPDKVALKGADDARQLVITAALAGDRLQDLTGDVKYDTADPKVANVPPSGRVVPLGNGKTEITARYGDKIVRAPVVVEAVEENLPINFGNQIVPIFGKLGCNSGG